jgi:hypothetical protein
MRIKPTTVLLFRTLFVNQNMVFESPAKAEGEIERPPTLVSKLAQILAPYRIGRINI